MANWNDSKFLKSVGVTPDREIVDAEKECQMLREEGERLLEQNRRLNRKCAELSRGMSPRTWKSVLIEVSVTIAGVLTAIAILWIGELILREVIR